MIAGNVPLGNVPHVGHYHYVTECQQKMTGHNHKRADRDSRMNPDTLASVIEYTSVHDGLKDALNDRWRHAVPDEPHPA